MEFVLSVVRKVVLIQVAVTARSLAPSHHQCIVAAAEKTDHVKGRYPAAGWALYHILKSELCDNKSTEIIFIDIDDFSEDFDFPQDYDKWQEKANNLPYTAVPKDQNRKFLKWKKRCIRRPKSTNLFIAFIMIGLGIIIGLII